MSQQCFINEYVFAIDDDERVQSQQICDRIVETLKTDRDVSVLDLVVAASYMPLHRLPMVSSLLNRTWPDSVTRLLTQQVEEPLEEEADRKNIPALTVVDDPVSLQIQKQYEENPYPRWTVSPTVTPTTIENYLASTIGLSSASWCNTANGVDILIAGCGTGSHSIETAQLFPQSRILALDISRASLAYARRKTGALAITNIEYGQADILKLGSIDRRFDLIEAVGVLHHLSDPAAGWRVLRSLLRPKGLMAVGLYSSLARQSVTAARAQIAERGYGASVEDIRTYRQELILRGQVPPFKDFWSTSGCRDLLFNVVEHQFTIPEIKAFLDANQLTFLGFEQLPAATVSQYQHQFPGAVAQRDLASWHAFEQMHPFTFANMYIFWVQKNAPVSPPARST
jgi:SAM-dependent methyltransferase